MNAPLTICHRLPLGLLLTLSDKSYALERAESLDPSGWATVQSITGDGKPRVLVDTNSPGSQCFYRVRAE